jgi:organic radical activating enzyme
MLPGSAQQFLGPQSVNLFITEFCNRKCPFCYLNNWVADEGKTAKYMTLEDIKVIIGWLKRSGIRRVKLAGGEPMLHIQLLDIVSELVKSQITIEGILTNGLGATNLYNEVADLSKTNWLVNVSPPETYTKEDWALLNKNLESLKWRNEYRSVKQYGFDTNSLRHLCLSITFYKPDQDYTYVIDLAKKYECPVIRYDVSRPSSDESNSHVDFEKLLEIKPTLLKFVEACVREGIKPGLDDALPFCIFTQNELKYLYLFSNFYSICVPHSDVMPDLTVEYCTSMRGVLPSHKIGTMKAGQMFQESISQSNKYRELLLPQCESCYNQKAGLCQGYCLRYKADLIEQEPKTKQSRLKWPKFST